jgi:hypothetical protein
LFTPNAGCGVAYDRCRTLRFAVGGAVDVVTRFRRRVASDQGAQASPISPTGVKNMVAGCCALVQFLAGRCPMTWSFPEAQRAVTS